MGLVAVMVASGLVLALLIGTTDQRSVELEELNRPTFPDQEIFVDSMADPSAPIARPEGISVR